MPRVRRIKITDFEPIEGLPLSRPDVQGYLLDSDKVLAHWHYPSGTRRWMVLDVSEFRYERGDALPLHTIREPFTLRTQYLDAATYDGFVLPESDPPLCAVYTGCWHVEPLDPPGGYSLVR